MDTQHGVAARLCPTLSTRGRLLIAVLRPRSHNGVFMNNFRGRALWSTSSAFIKSRRPSYAGLAAHGQLPHATGQYELRLAICVAESMPQPPLEQSYPAQSLQTQPLSVYVDESAHTEPAGTDGDAGSGGGQTGVTSAHETGHAAMRLAICVGESTPQPP